MRRGYKAKSSSLRDILGFLYSQSLNHTGPVGTCSIEAALKEVGARVRVN